MLTWESSQWENLKMWNISKRVDRRARQIQIWDLDYNITFVGNQPSFKNVVAY